MQTLQTFGISQARNKICFKLNTTHAKRCKKLMLSRFVCLGLHPQWNVFKTNGLSTNGHISCAEEIRETWTPPERQMKRVAELHSYDLLLPVQTKVMTSHSVDLSVCSSGVFSLPQHLYWRKLFSLSAMQITEKSAEHFPDFAVLHDARAKKHPKADYICLGTLMESFSIGVTC